MHRLFVAIRPPPEVRSWLLARMGGVSGARWQSEDQLHLTLRFVGDVDRPVAEDVAAALSGIWMTPFEVEPRGIGAFEHRGRPETLWAGVQPLQPLKTLHSKIDQACVRAGLEPERRAYTPHITLARLGRDSGPIAGLLELEGGAVGPAFTVDGFGLFESRRGPDGASYSLIEHYPAR